MIEEVYELVIKKYTVEDLLSLLAPDSKNKGLMLKFHHTNGSTFWTSDCSHLVVTVETRELRSKKEHEKK